MQPMTVTCENHMGSASARVHTWDGKKWNYSSDWYQADAKVLNPLVKADGDKYLADRKLARRADCH